MSIQSKMNDKIILFEDEGYRALLPLALSRPVFELRCGIFTLRERIAAMFGAQPSAICRSYLANIYGAGRWPLGLLGERAPLTFVNGRSLDIPWLPCLREEPIDTIYITDGGPGVLNGTLLLGARLSPALTSAVLFYLLHQEGELALNELRRFARVVEVEATLLTFPWDMIVANGQQITDDLPLLKAATQWDTSLAQSLADAHIVVYNPSQVYIHPDAKLIGPLVLDARDGPIVIDAATIEPFSFIQGPTAIGAGSLIASARLRGETTIGPICRIGGEVEASIVQGYSNKHHDGFLGHSYLGEWVNIGAMTTNSDLKNTYGSIRVVLDGFGQLDSGQLKLGCFLSDHVKLGIGVHLNGGAVIGTGSNIFGVHFAPKTVPPFTWGGELFSEYEIDRMIGVARKVTARRKIVLSSEQEALLRAVFAMTRGSRAHIASVSDKESGRSASEGGEAALARAEVAAIHGFEPVRSAMY